MFNVPAGVQLKVDPMGPVGLPPKTISSPIQISVSTPASTIGEGFIVITTLVVSKQPLPSVPVTV